MSIAIGSDHAGYQLKSEIIEHLQKAGHIYKDYGCYSSDRVDYPDFANEVAEAVSSRQFDMGIVICGTGIGVSITANKKSGIRAALCCSEYMAEMARKHNNANVLALGGRTTPPERAVQIVDIFIKTDFEGGRHARRIQKIHSLTGN